MFRNKVFAILPLLVLLSVSSAFAQEFRAVPVGPDGGMGQGMGMGMGQGMGQGMGMGMGQGMGGGMGMGMGFGQDDFSSSQGAAGFGGAGQYGPTAPYLGSGYGQPDAMMPGQQGPTTPGGQTPYQGQPVYEEPSEIEKFFNGKAPKDTLTGKVPQDTTGKLQKDSKDSAPGEAKEGDSTPKATEDTKDKVSQDLLDKVPLDIKDSGFGKEKDAEKEKALKEKMLKQRIRNEFERKGKTNRDVKEIIRHDLITDDVLNEYEEKTRRDLVTEKAREELTSKAPEDLSFDIKQFGYQLFLRSPYAAPYISPAERNLPVGESYVIGPGDEARINLWGGIDGTFVVRVDREGNINIPKVGTIGVAGLTFEELKQVVHKEISKNYTGFEMSISMGGRLRSIRVYVVGNAKKPGSYSVSSVSSLVNALFQTGGPSKVGTMRDLQVIRNGQTLTHLDLYDFLIKGRKDSDLRLMPEDTIFIPPIGPIAGIAGNVMTPAIYELKGKTRVSDLIKMAGGATAQSDLQRIQIERVFENTSKVILDTNMKQMKGKNDIYIQNGDLVKILPIMTIVENRVRLQGNVLRPGVYQWKEGMRIGDVLKSPKDLLPDTHMDMARVDRLVPPDNHQEYKIFNLGKLLLENDQQENIRLEPFDVLIVYNKSEVQMKSKVRADGALHKPGEFEFRANMKLSDLIRLSGGLQRYALMESAELTRVTPTPEGPKVERFCVNPGNALNGDSLDDIPLQEDDYLLVRTVPEWQLQQFVTLMGEVRYPGKYTVEKGEKLSSLLTRAGGFTARAYPRGAVLTRESAKILQKALVKENIDRLERELMANGTTDLSAKDAEDPKLAADEITKKQQFIRTLKLIEPKGRMVIKLDSPEKLRSSPEDLELESKDVLFIPQTLHSVQVVGAVYNQTSFTYKEGVSYSYYVDNCGGFTKNADKKNLYIMKVDGRAIRPKNSLLWNPFSRKWDYGYAQLEPGDSIVVPERLERVPWMKNIKDITTIVANIVTTAGYGFLIAK